MKYLLYCLCEHPGPKGRKPPKGIGGRPVFLVGKNGLCAAVSRICDSELACGISSVLAYEKVVESIHRRQGIIPLRYGSVLASRAAIARLLQHHGRHYAALLRALEGRVEMGIRVLCGPAERGGPASARNGAAYLAVRRDHYARDARLTARLNQVANDICSSLSGLFVRSKTEMRVIAGKHLLSVHFLVAKRFLQRFRRACTRIKLRGPMRVLLTGPWPPYSFCSSTEKMKGIGSLEFLP